MAAAITLPDGTSTDTPKWHKRRYTALEGLRAPHMAVWEGVREYIAPGLLRSFRNQAYQSRVALDTSKVIDTTATHAANTTAAGMMAGITSPARRWMRTTVALMRGQREIPGEWKEWLQHLDDELFKFWNRSNLYTMLMGIYPELILFGTAAGYGHANYVVGENDFIWGQFLAGEYVIAEDADGLVRTIYWVETSNVEKLVGKYARNGQAEEEYAPAKRGMLSSRVRQAWRNGQWHEAVQVVHVLHRTPLVDARMRGEALWEHVVFERDSTEGQDEAGNFLERQMLEHFPAFCVRWEKNSMSPWGIGPGALVLSDVIQLQEMEEKKASALSLLIAPPMVGDPSLQNMRKSTLPGDVTYAPGATQGRPGFAPAYQVDPRMADFEHSMELVRGRIKDALHSVLFSQFIDRAGVQPLNESEIWERKEEKMVVLGAVLDRFGKEALDPLIEISVRHLFQSGVLGDPPEGLQEMDFEFLNVIAIAQRTQGLTAISDTVSFVRSMGETEVALGRDPTAWDVVDVDKTIRLFAERRGADVNVLHDEEEVEELRDMRAQAMQQQQAMEQAAAAAATAKDAAAAEELSARTQADLGPAATGAGPGALPAAVGA